MHECICPHGQDPSVTGAQGKPMGFNRPFHYKLLESRDPLCPPLPQSAACLPNSSKAIKGVGLPDVPLGAQAQFWLYHL